jgi:hypothetical protein
VRAPGERMKRTARRPRAEWICLGLLLLAATAQRAWNATTIVPLRGYDAPGHAAYIFTAAHEGRLPHPTEGWSTFHPPLYYVLGAGAWKLLAPFGPDAVQFGLRMIGGLAGILAAFVIYRCARSLGASAPTAWVATALFLFVPSNQMAAVMIGNEALCAALAVLAIPPLLALQSDPTDRRAASLAGLFIGLALITKYNSVTLLPAALTPFVVRRPNRESLAAMATLAATVAVVASPVYLRNFIATGSPIPMTREIGPMQRAENSMILRPRKASDYIWLDPIAIRRPSLFQTGPLHPKLADRNPAMANVWGLTHASIWFDPFLHRTPAKFHRDGSPWGVSLASLGIVPTTTMLAGFFLALGAAIRTRGRSPWTPLLVLWTGGVLLFVAFTLRAPSAAAVKGSYMLPIAGAGTLFFSHAATALRQRGRRTLLVVCATIAAGAGVFFTEGVFGSPRANPQFFVAWLAWSRELPGSNVDSALLYFRSPQEEDAAGGLPSSKDPNPAALPD